MRDSARGRASGTRRWHASRTFPGQRPRTARERRRRCRRRVTRLRPRSRCGAGEDLRQTCAPSTGSFSGPGGHGLRPARAQRRGQVDGGEDPLHAQPADAGAASVAGTTCSPTRRRAPRDRRRRAELGLRPRTRRGARTSSCRAALDVTGRAPGAARRRPARAIRPHRSGRPRSPRLLGRHAAAARHRARARPPAARCCSSTSPRRASIPRPAPRCGADRRPRARGGAHDPAHDALPGGGRPARGAARDHRSRPGRGDRLAGGAQGRRCTATPCRSSSPTARRRRRERARSTASPASARS